MPVRSLVPDKHLARVRAELVKHPHLRRHRAVVAKGQIIVYEPDDIIDYLLMPAFRIAPAPPEAFGPSFRKGMTYSQLMRFRPVGREYAVSRSFDGGLGNWIDRGPIGRMVVKYVRKIGTRAFFELH